jgi:alcohol dehydrogenase class IV
VIGEKTDDEVQYKARGQEARDLEDAGRLDFGEFLAAVPTDGDQQVHRQALVDHVRELEVHLQDPEQESEVEEKQQRLEEVVQEVLEELVKHSISPGSRGH